MYEIHSPGIKTSGLNTLMAEFRGGGCPLGCYQTAHSWRMLISRVLPRRKVQVITVTQLYLFLNTELW